MRYELIVDRKQLLDGLTLLRKAAKPKQNMEAVFTFHDGNLNILANGVSVEAAAEGTFPGRVCIPAVQIIKLAELARMENRLAVAHDKKRLYVGIISIPCTWHDAKPKPIQLPMDAPATVLLALPLRYTQQQILQSGLSKRLAEAQLHRDQLITKALNFLQELGVAQIDIEELVTKSIKRMNDL